MSSAEYGKTTTPSEAFLSDIPLQDETPKKGIDGYANPLWMYQNLDNLNGIPIDPSAQGLPIDREELLEAALYLDRSPRSMIFWMSPEDTESIQKYDKLLEDQENGKLIIVEEQKQYDMNKSKFMVWIRYDLLRYKLHPRFEYLRESKA